MQLIKKILFPTDFGDSMGVALKSVIDIAKKFDSEIILLHVIPEQIKSTHLKEKIKAKMEAFNAEVMAEGVSSHFELSSGDSADAIIEVADRVRANLIILGAGRGRKMEFRLGSNSEKIILKSSMPVWVIEKDKPVMMDTVLCPVDFSKESQLALDNAIHLCRRFNSKLVVMHVVKSYEEDYADIDTGASLIGADWINNVSNEFDSFLEEANLTGLNWEKELKLGKPYNEIMEYITAEHIGLVVMGSSSKTGLRKLFLGSVAEKIARKVPCSFVMIKSESLIHLSFERELTDIDLIYQEGVQLNKDGFTEEAISMWKKCTSLNYYHMKAWTAIVSAYESLGDLDSAKSFNDVRNRIQKTIWDSQIEADLRSKNSLFK